MARRWRSPRRALGWVFGAALYACSRLCRRRTLNDPRPGLRAKGTPYVVALLHAHQLAALLANDEPRGDLAAMVSRSADGELVVPAMRVRGVRPVRGSSGALKKRGPQALVEMRDWLAGGGGAALLTVDGPRGPRSRVKPGVAELALGVPGAVVLTVLALPSRRWVLRRSWERFQIPKPFSTISLVFGETLRPDAAEGREALRARIEAELVRLEREWDPVEASAPRTEVASARLPGTAT